MHRKIISFILTLAFVLTLSGCERLGVIPVTEEYGDFEVVFLNVGQADCIYIRCGESRMLIDGGNRADSGTVLGFLKTRGINELDYIVSTHPHEDHCGGLEAVIKNFNVKFVLSPVTAYKSSSFDSFSKAVVSKGLEFTVPSPGDTYILGGAYFTVLGPVRNYEDMNDNSIVIKLEYGGFSFIFTGDAGYEAEKDMLETYRDLDADVLKVAHHGSSSGSCYHWIRETAPDHAVISVGEDNDYGHPSEKVLSRLKDAGANILRTDELGDITITVEKGQLCVYSENEAFSPAA